MDYILEMQHITKTFPGVKALDNVSVQIERGTVHAIMGENGAGKSTLMKVLFGMYRADKGTILLNGEKVSIRSTKDSLEMGVSMIYQELSPIKDISVAENIFVGRYPKNKLGLVDWKTMWSKSKELFSQWGMKYNPRQAMRSLRMADTQIIEIMKAISFDAKIIIMDEPTSAITEREVQKLFAFIRELRNRGITVVIITHKLDEVFQIADRVTVLRDGQYIGTKDIGDLTKDEMITMMVGREISKLYPEHTQREIGESILQVEHLQNGTKVKDVSFELRKGEILGFAGIMGAGRTETMRCIFGLDHPQSGKVLLNGQQLRIKSVRDAIKSEIMMATESRKDDGLVLCRSILENMMLPGLYRHAHMGIIKKQNERGAATEMAKKLHVKTPSLAVKANSLSGGNQQKIILGKWLLMNPTVLILDEPTRGIDVGTKAEIYHIMVDLAKAGVSIILISSDMEEVIGMSDRIVVMCEGRISKILEKPEITQEKIMQYSAEVS